MTAKQLLCSQAPLTDCETISCLYCQSSEAGLGVEVSHAMQGKQGKQVWHLTPLLKCTELLVGGWGWGGAGRAERGQGDWLFLASIFGKRTEWQHSRGTCPECNLTVLIDLLMYFRVIKVA